MCSKRISAPHLAAGFEWRDTISTISYLFSFGFSVWEYVDFFVVIFCRRVCLFILFFNGQKNASKAVATGGASGFKVSLFPEAICSYFLFGYLFVILHFLTNTFSSFSNNFQKHFGSFIFIWFNEMTSRSTAAQLVNLNHLTEIARDSPTTKPFGGAIFTKSGREWSVHHSIPISNKADE